MKATTMKSFATICFFLTIAVCCSQANKAPAKVRAGDKVVVVGKGVGGLSTVGNSAAADVYVDCKSKCGIALAIKYCGILTKYLVELWNSLIKISIDLNHLIASLKQIVQRVSVALTVWRDSILSDAAHVQLFLPRINVESCICPLRKCLGQIDLTVVDQCYPSQRIVNLQTGLSVWVSLIAQARQKCTGYSVLTEECKCLKDQLCQQQNAVNGYVNDLKNSEAETKNCTTNLKAKLKCDIANCRSRFYYCVKHAPCYY